MYKISISGPMAVGKTTLIRALCRSVPGASAIYEDAAKVNAIYKDLSAESSANFARDFKQILFLNDLCKKFEQVDSELVFVDKGVEDYIFFWLRSYELMDNPRPDFEPFIQRVYDNLAGFHSDKIIYLNAPDDVLVSRKSIDQTRARGFFDEFLERFRKRELEFFCQLGAETLETGHLNETAVFDLVREKLGLGS